MFPCRTAAAEQYTSATSFCDTRTIFDSTASNWPTHATAACDSKESSISSACICGPLCYPHAGPCSPSPAPPGVILYDSLDCHLPNVERLMESPARYAILDVGFKKGCLQVWPAILKGTINGVPLRLHYKDIAVDKQRKVQISFKILFWGPETGFIRIVADKNERNPVFFWPPLEKPPLEQPWLDVEATFLPSFDKITFWIDIGLDGQAWIKIDEIVVRYAD